MAGRGPPLAGHPTDRLMGDSPPIRDLRAHIRHLTAFDTVGNPAVPTLLLQGETGTGKGLIARVIHDGGPRAPGPFIEINCAALPESLLEAEVFGFEAGTFTDAKRAKPGLFEAASGGTLFLDEVDALPLALQSKLLTAVEEKRVRRLGAVLARDVDVKLIAATQVDLPAQISAGQFRADLYQRLAVIVLPVPPLRQRPEDVVILAEHFLRRYAEAHGLTPKRLNAAAVAWLRDHGWPGNVREVSHLLERVTLLCPEAVLEPAMLERWSLSQPPAPTRFPHAPAGSDRRPLDEPARIQQALRQTGGNVVRAARLLGLSRKALRYRLERYGIEPPRLDELDPALAGRDLQASPGYAKERDEVAPEEPQAPASGWEQKPVAVLAIDLTLPKTSGLATLPYEPWTVTRHWQQIVAEKVQGFGGMMLQSAPPLLMAVFGVPRTLELLPHRAIHVASAIRHLVEEATLTAVQEPYPEMRFAVHLGPLLVDLQARDPTTRLPAVGDTLALPARLLGHAGPGEILVSAQVGRLVEGSFALQERAIALGADKPDRAAAYAIIERQSQQPLLPGPRGRPRGPFVGRGRELTMLYDLLAEVEAGLGQVVGILGEPGMGKSRLLGEFRQGLTAKPVTYLEGRCFAYSQGMPYLPVLDLLCQFCGITEVDTPEVRRTKVHLGLQAVGIDRDAGGPYLLHLLGVQERADRLASLTAEAIKAGIFHNLCQLLLIASRRQPLVLAVENFHWIDQPSAAWLASLVERLVGTPILLLCTYRPGHQPPWMQTSYATQLTLKPLSAHDSLCIVHSVLQSEQVPEALAQTILAKAEGNPFFLEELSWAVGEHGDRRQPLTVPDTIQEVLLARIDQLSDQTRKVLQMASVVGRQASLRLLEKLWKEPVGLTSHLQELTRLEFLYERMAGEEPVYAFKHALIQEVAYNSLPSPYCQALHAAVGQALEVLYAHRLEEVYDHLAYHYSHTQETEKAVDYLTRFAQRVARSYAHGEAITALQEALVHAERLPAEERDRRRLEVSLRLALSLAILGRYREILDLLLGQRQRLEQLADPLLASAYYFRLGMTYGALGDHAQAAEYASQAIEAGMQCGNEATLGKAYYVLSHTEYMRGQPQSGLEYSRRAAALLERTEERHHLGLAYWLTASHSLYLGEFAAGLEAAERAETVGNAMEDFRIQSFAAATAGWIYAMRGERELGLEACHRGLARARDPVVAAGALACTGCAYPENGDPAEAIPRLEQAVQQIGHLRMRATQGRFMAFLSEAYLLNGELEKGHELALQGLKIAEDTHNRYAVGWAQRALGRIAQASGALAEAKASLSEALDTFTSIQARFEVARTHLDLAAVAHAAGTREAVATHLQEAHDLFRALRVPKYEDRSEQLAEKFAVPLPFPGGSSPAS